MKAPESRGLKAALAALGYLTAARLALLLAVPPGYSTAVWPAAGLAMGLCWVWGWEVLPGIFVGAALANAWMTADRGFFSAASAALSLWIAAGVTAQAAAAVALARRESGGRPPLEGSDADAARFLLLGGPAACVVAATWATLGLRLSGAVPAAETFYSWLTWWSGDTMGVALGAPLVLLWIGQKAESRRIGTWAVAAVSACLLAGLSALQVAAVRAEERLSRAEAARRLADVSLNLRVGIGGHMDALRSAADLFSSRESVTRAEFTRFARGMLDRHPGLQAVEWRPRVSDERRAAVEAAARREGLTGFVFTGLDENGRIVPRDRAPHYFPILYVEPLKGNERALGLDVDRSQHESRETAARALSTRRPAASAGVRLIQEEGTEMGILVMVPVFRASDGQPIGLLEGVFRVGDLMGTLLAGTGTDTLDVRLIDVTDPSEPRALYARGNPDAQALDSVAMSGDFAGRRWRVELASRVGAQGPVRRPLGAGTLLALLAMTLLVSWAVLSLRARASRLA